MELGFWHDKKKPFSDGELVKEIIISTMDTLLENYDSQAKCDIMQKVRNLQFSHQTVCRRIQDMSTDLEEQLKDQLKTCLAFSICLDESTDISDTAQIALWIRFVSEDMSIHEELLALHGMKDQTRGINILGEFDNVVSKFQLNLEKMVSVTSDGAPAMTGKNSGFVGLLKKQLNTSSLNGDSLVSFHCILHQENLCAQMKEDDSLKDLMNMVVEIVNYIRGSALNHRQFIELLKESEDCQFGDIIYFANVRWLSRGKVLQRFTSLLPEIQDFLIKKEKLTSFSVIEEEEWKCDLFFLTDITAHMNELNLKLQGKGKLVWDLSQHLEEFISKLQLFIVQMKVQDFTHFQNIASYAKKYDFDKYRYVDWLQSLLQKFEQRFLDFEKFQAAFQFIRDPLNFDVQDANLSRDLSNLLCFNKGEFETDMLLLQSQRHKQLKSESLSGMWTRILKTNDFLTLNTLIAKIFSMFGSTWLCESTFSAMTFTKSKYRSRLLDENLEAQLRCSLSIDLIPNFRELVTKKDCQISH